MATAAKAKLLLRELKTVKADLAFAKARCAQLEEENKMLRDREGTDKGQSREDDDMVLISLWFPYFKFVIILLRSIDKGITKFEVSCYYVMWCFVISDMSVVSESNKDIASLLKHPCFIGR